MINEKEYDIFNESSSPDNKLTLISKNSFQFTPPNLKA